MSSLDRSVGYALDLFAGTGGLSCGFGWAGGHVAGAIEYDANAAAQVWVDDIRSLSTRAVADQIGRVDVILGRADVPRPKRS